ncbi:DUF1016 N-terminal domain-containing protein [Candidatus Omnitrophota bacterium]
MTQNTILTVSKYRKLLSDVRKIIQEGKARALTLANQELVVTYWQVGRRICEEGLAGQGGYGESILADLAEELGIDLSTIFRTIQFFQTYPQMPNEESLSWSHYKYLIPLGGSPERKWYEGIASQEGLTAPQLATAIKRGRFEEFQSQKGRKVKSKKLKRPQEATYVYKAFAKRVVDGDTILLHIDLGFAVLKEQRIRLAGIDCPAIDEPKGREAFLYVRDLMARVPFVMVKTNKIDIYGRYVGHVFYSLKVESKVKIFENGRYLSQELVDKGLAKII